MLSIPPEHRKQAGFGQRRSVRLPVGKLENWQGAITFQEEIPVLTVLDVSMGGCSLVLDQWVGPGTVLSATLAGSDAAEFSKDLRVVYVSSRPEGGCVAGCQFLAPLNYEQFMALIS